MRIGEIVRGGDSDRECDDAACDIVVPVQSMCEQREKHTRPELARRTTSLWRRRRLLLLGNACTILVFTLAALLRDGDVRPAGLLLSQARGHGRVVGRQLLDVVVGRVEVVVPVAHGEELGRFDELRRRR